MPLSEKSQQEKVETDWESYAAGYRHAVKDLTLTQQEKSGDFFWIIWFFLILGLWFLFRSYGRES